MLRAPLLPALAPEPACGARDGAGLTPPTADQIAGMPVKGGRTGLARHRVRHPGDRRGQVPVPYGHPRRAIHARAWAVELETISASRSRFSDPHNIAKAL
jgi:hypothetical protein